MRLLWIQLIFCAYSNVCTNKTTFSERLFTDLKYLVKVQFSSAAKIQQLLLNGKL